MNITLVLDSNGRLVTLCDNLEQSEVNVKSIYQSSPSCLLKMFTEAQISKALVFLWPQCPTPPLSNSLEGIRETLWDLLHTPKYRTHSWIRGLLASVLVKVRFVKLHHLRGPELILLGQEQKEPVTKLQLVQKAVPLNSVVRSRIRHQICFPLDF